MSIDPKAIDNATYSQKVEIIQGPGKHDMYVCVCPCIWIMQMGHTKN